MIMFIKKISYELSQIQKQNLTCVDLKYKHEIKKTSADRVIYDTVLHTAKVLETVKIDQPEIKVSLSKSSKRMRENLNNYLDKKPVKKIKIENQNEITKILPCPSFVKSIKVSSKNSFVTSISEKIGIPYIDSIKSVENVNSLTFKKTFISLIPNSVENVVSIKNMTNMVDKIDRPENVTDINQEIFKKQIK